MLNHKFYCYDDNVDGYFFQQTDFIRISDRLITDMAPILKKHRFIDYSTGDSVSGLSEITTLLNSEEIEYFIACLNEKFNEENEYGKFVHFFETCLFNHKKIVHADGSPKFGGLIHKFALCNKIPEQAQSSDFENELIKIQDQFIEENYNVFKNVTVYWNELGNLEQGFNYYGRTIITPEQASEMLQAVYVFLEENESEQAEYFIGKDWDTLEKILKTAISEEKMILHFGI